MKKLLVVEDNETLRLTYRDILDDEYEVTLAQSVEEALKLLNDGYKPDIILSDLMMPQYDGLEFFAVLDRLPGLAGVPRLMVTGANENVVRLERAIRKPFDLLQLKAALKAA